MSFLMCWQGRVLKNLGGHLLEMQKNVLPLVLCSLLFKNAKFSKLLDAMILLYVG